MTRVRRRRDEQGAIALMIAVTFSSVLLVIGGLVVDIGSQRVARRDMQAVADVVALDMSRKLDGATGASTLTASSAWTTALSKSVARNANGRAPVVTAAVGTVDSNGVFTAVTGATVPSAVRVVANTTVGFAFGMAKSGGATRSAVASNASTACFKLGSYAARINTDAGLLRTLLNGALGANIDIGSYQGLAATTANIPLLQLAAQLNVGTIDQLATTSVTVKNLYLAAAQVLSANGHVAEANLLNTIATSLTLNGTVNLGSVLNATTGNGAALGATINALDLVSGTAFLINGSNLLAIPSLATTIGLTGTDLATSVKVIEAAHESCGGVGTTAKTSQVDLDVTGTLANLAVPNILGGLVLNAGVNGTAIHLSAASATGKLTNIVCGAGTTASPTGMDVAVSPSLVSGSISQSIKLDGSVGAGLLGILGLGGLVQVKGAVTYTATIGTGSTTPQTASVRYPVRPSDWNTPVSTGSGSLGLDATTLTPVWTTPLTATILGIPLDLTALTNLTNMITSALVGSVLSPLISIVNTTLVAPLSQMLGLTIGGADVYGLPTPSCNTPSLTG